MTLKLLWLEKDWSEIPRALRLCRTSYWGRAEVKAISQIQSK